MSSAGFNRPGIECLHCHQPFSLALGTGAMTTREVEKLPDPFLAKCPLCDQEATYPKDAIGTLAGLGPQ